MNRLIHYSSRPIEGVTSVTQKEEPFGKPNGLWVSVGDAWRRYNWELRQDRVHKLQFKACVYANHIRLAPEANLLLINNCDEFDRFNDRYGRAWNNPNVPDGRLIDWTAVAEQHQGIVIAPFLRHRAWDANGKWISRSIWYWTWVCASGCIWDAGAVDDFAVEFLGEQDLDRATGVAVCP